jgi:hypothetical protein
MFRDLPHLPLMVWFPVRSEGCVAGACASTLLGAGPPSGSATLARAALRTRRPGRSEIVVFRLPRPGSVPWRLT